MEQNQYGFLEKIIDSQSLSINMFARKEFLMPRFHYHTSHEVFYIKKGTANFIIGDKSWMAYDGTLLVIPPYLPHRSIYENSNETYRIELQVNSALLSKDIAEILDLLSKNICYTLPLRHQTDILKLLNKMNAESHSAEPYADKLCLAYISELLITVYRNAVRNSTASSADTHLASKIMEYISQNYMHTITIAELSHIFHVCESTIYKSFKKHTGLKITDYINFTRIMNAERLMRETNLTLTEIAFQCGFNDCNYFSGVFKRYKNMTPGKYMRTKRTFAR